MNILARLTFAAIVFALNGCAYSTLGLKKKLPTEQAPVYGLYAGITPLKYVPAEVPVKTYFDASVSDWKSGKRLFTWRRVIMLRWPHSNPTDDNAARLRSLMAHYPKLTGGMNGRKIRVELQERYSPIRQWMLEVEDGPDGRFTLTKESGEFIR